MAATSSSTVIGTLVHGKRVMVQQESHAHFTVGFRGEKLYHSLMGVSENDGTPKSSILIGISIINRPFWGPPYFWKHPYGI